jgi:hypothetical protein
MHPPPDPSVRAVGPASLVHAPDLEEPALQDFKNVSLSPVDVGGRVLAVGEIATLSPFNHAVHEAVSTGCLLAVATFVEPPAQAYAGDDEATDEAADEKPVKACPEGLPPDRSKES